MGVLTYQTNEGIERERQRQGELQSQRISPVVTGLAAHVQSCWEAARSAKEPIQKRMLECLRMRRGEYSQEQLARISENNSNAVYMGLTGEKCTAAESWVEDILSPVDEKPWGIDPTPVPELSPEQNEKFQKLLEQEFQSQAAAELQQSAQERAQATGLMMQITPEMIQARAAQIRQEKQAQVEELEKRILEMTQEKAKEADLAIERRLEDELIESGWEDALAQAIPEVIGSLAGFIKGPIVRRRKVMAWGKGQNGRSVPVIREEIAKEFKSPSPFDIYPGPDSHGIDDGYLIEVHRMSRGDLSSLIGVPGYNEQGIRNSLIQYGHGGLRDWLWLSHRTERDRLEGRHSPDRDPDGKIEAIQFWGSVMGKHLIEFGLPAGQVPDPFAEYQAEVWLIGSNVIRAALNPHPLGKKPYFKASFRSVSNSFWGMGLPELIRDIQEVCNSATRSAVDNMKLASGPQVGVDVSMLPEGEDISEVFPLKIWQVSTKSASAGNARQPVWFFQPALVAPQLMQIYKEFSEEADLKSGVPKYSYGAGGSSGALGTATGMSMMMNAAARGIKRVIRAMDKGLIRPSIEALWMWLMLYQQDPEFMRGDIHIVARGTSALVAREQQQVRRNEFLNLALQPPVHSLIGDQGLAEVLRPMARDLGYDDAMVPTDEELAARAQAMQQQAAMEQAAQGGQTAPAAPRTVDQAGQPAGGQDSAVF